MPAPTSWGARKGFDVVRILSSHEDFCFFFRIGFPLRWNDVVDSLKHLAGDVEHGHRGAYIDVSILLSG